MSQAALHFFVGADDFTSHRTLLKWRGLFEQKHAAAAVLELDGESDADTLRTGLNNVSDTPSLFSTTTLVIVRQPFLVKGETVEELLEKLWRSAVPNELVVLCWQRGEPDKRRVLYKKAQALVKGGQAMWHQSDAPAPYARADWLVKECQRLGTGITVEAAKYVAAALQGEPMWSLATAAALLATVSPGVISEDLARRYIVARGALDTFGVTDQLAVGNSRAAWQALSEYTLSRQPVMAEGIALMGALTWLIRTATALSAAYNKGLSGDMAAREAKITPFVVRKISPLTKRLSYERLLAAWQRAGELEQQVKSGQTELVFACEQLIWAVT